MHSHHSKGLLSTGNRPLYAAFPSLGTAGAIAGICALTLFHLWLANYLPPADDELYYWSWAQSLQMSYYDHPPMMAYLIRMSTALFGDSVLTLRLPAVFLSLAVSLILLAIARRGNLVWCLLFCPMAFLGGVLMTPDLPLVFFWLLYAVWFAWINGTLDGWNTDPITRVYSSSPVSYLQWILGGVLLGFGGLSKYTMLLAVPCGLGILATRTRFRAWGIGYALHLAVAGILVFPVFLFSWRYSFGPLAFQWTHTMGGWDISFSRFFDFVGVQIVLVGALPFLLFPWILLRHRDLCADARSQAYFVFFVLPFTFFLYKGLTQRLEANWTLVAYLTFWPLADRLLSWSSFRGIVRGVVVVSFLVPWAVSFAAVAHLISPFSRVEPRHDRIAVLRGQWQAASDIAAELKSRGVTETLWLPSYQWTAYFRFLKTPSDQLVPSGRHSQFTIGDAETCAVEKGAFTYAIDVGNGPEPSLHCFPHREVLREFPVLARGQEVGRLWLSRYSK